MAGQSLTPDIPLGPPKHCQECSLNTNSSLSTLGYDPQIKKEKETKNKPLFHHVQGKEMGIKANQKGGRPMVPEAEVPEVQLKANTMG